MKQFITRTLVFLLLALWIHLVMPSPVAQISEGADVSGNVAKTRTNDSEGTVHKHNGTFTIASVEVHGNINLSHYASLQPDKIIEIVLSSAWKLRNDPNKKNTTNHLPLTEVKENKSVPYENLLKWAKQTMRTTEMMESQANGSLLHFLSETNLTNAVRDLLLIGADASAQEQQGDTPLHGAVRGGAYDVMRLLIEAGASPNVPGMNDLTPLDVAATRGDAEAVRILIRGGSNTRTSNDIANVFTHVIRNSDYNALKALINGIGVFPKRILKMALVEAIKIEDRKAIRLLIAAEVDDLSMGYFQAYPLSEATEPGREDILRALLDAWGYVDERNEQGLTPLMIAAYNNNPGSIRMLVEAGAILEDVNYFNSTALLCAARGGGTEALTALLNLGANVNATENSEENALHKAVWNNAAVTATLLGAGIDKEARNEDGRTPVFMGARQSTDALHLLLKANVSLDTRDNYNRTPFIHHVIVGDNYGTAVFLDLAPDLEERDADGNNALLLAAKQASEARCYFDYGQSEPLTIVKMLVEAGADVDAQNYEGTSSLHWFVNNGFVPAIEYMLSVGADKDIRDKRGYTPLHYAAENGYMNPLRTLLHERVDVEARDRQGRSPLIVAATNDKSYAVPYLARAGAKVNARDESGRTALHWAAKGGIDTVRSLLKNGANVNATDSSLQIPLHWAVERETIVGELLNAGSDKNAQDVSGSTPLLLAVQNDCEGCVQKLLQVGVDVNIQDKKGETPAMYATEKNNVKTLEMLSKAGADLNKRSNEGYTALHFATVNGSVNALRDLIKMGVTVDARDNYGKTPLHWAAERNNLKALEALLAAGAGVNLPDASGSAALHWAAREGGERVVRRLIRAGADVNAEDERKKTPLWDAVFSDDPSSAALLISAGGDVNHVAQGRTPLELANEKSGASEWKIILQEAKKMQTEGSEKRNN